MQLSRHVTFSIPNSVHEPGALPAVRIAPVVFVVDDDPLLGAARRCFFESRQCSVALFKDPRSFLDHLPRDPHGCALLDIDMGVMSGFDVLQELARRGCHLPIIFVSENTQVSTIVEAMKRGAFHFFAKPVDPDALYETALLALKHDQKAREQRIRSQSLLARAALLTPREMHVARLVAAGMLNKQIAAELGIVEKTVKVHRGRVVKKLRVGSVAELVRFMDALGGDDATKACDDA